MLLEIRLLRSEASDVHPLAQQAVTKGNASIQVLRLEEPQTKLPVPADEVEGI